MAKLTIEELKKVREKSKEKMKLREAGGTRGRVIVHMGTCGIHRGYWRHDIGVCRPLQP